ncbi:glycosyltransferase family 1 protein, partial [Conyzicola sp.]|uniref:glycosyltransferase family 1 protein n=1 Tax=Conyzicola sp. TaxID=1969404 RepID=UPI0039897330
MKKTPPVGEIYARLRKYGVADASRRVIRRLSDRLDTASLDFPLLAEDIADSHRPPTLGAAPKQPGAALDIGWVCTPPAAGSGGHTTLFRMVEEAELRGHRTVLYLYDRHGGDLERHTRRIREYWPALSAEIRDARDGMTGMDAWVASSWETAHVIASRVTEGAARLYFVQDFEPYFHPRGTLYAMAEDSYHFGFTIIALGDLVARELTDRGIATTFAPFGCDTDVYSLDNADGPRSGVAYYTKPGSDRRGYLLGRLALEEFHRRHPLEPVHLYGDASDDWSIPTVQHNRLSPAALNRLYNETKAGLAISFTNVSLVAEEMLAAGTVPVVTMGHARDDLTNPHAGWADATPGAIADALGAVVGRTIDGAERRAIAGSVRRG